MKEMFEKGRVIGPYRIVRPLGKGGMGAVYEVEHEKLAVRYALKTFILDDGDAELFRKRFRAEGRILARLNHPGIVRVFDLDIDPVTGVLYYVMDLVLYKDGEAYTLADLEPGGADEDHLVQWFRELCSALSYIHSQGVVHRDIKLSNILIAPERHVFLSDFGISKVRDEKLRTDIDVTKTFCTGAGVAEKLVMGTAGYMAPEVLQGDDVTPAADVYSLGVVFFKLLTGVWYNPDMAKGDRSAIHLLDNFEYPWAGIVPAMLEENPLKRPDDLCALADSLVVKPQAAGKRMPKWAWWVSVGTVVAAVFSGIWFGLRTSSDKSVSDEDLTAAFDIPESVK